MKLLDLFCGAGGCSVGYARAGFEVVGVDIEPHPSYPYTFIRGDALEVIGDLWREFDAIHASPPCQTFTRAQHLRNAQGKTTDKLDLLAATRGAIRRTSLPYVIENVPGAPLLVSAELCGSMFGLKVRRHRIFETTFAVLQPACDHAAQGRPVGIYGSMRDDIPQGGRTASSIEEAREAMGIDWMRWRSTNQEWNDIKEAIPPAYTEFIGEQLMAHLAVAA